MQHNIEIATKRFCIIVRSKYVTVHSVQACEALEVGLHCFLNLAVWESVIIVRLIGRCSIAFVSTQPLLLSYL
jgi:hypothetical protein